MKLYFLVEGLTERKLYPAWLQYLVPNLTRITDPAQRIDNGYYLISGGGFPQLLDKRLPDSVEDITGAGDYSHFIVSLDSDNMTFEDKMDEIRPILASYAPVLGNCAVKLIVQCRCVETWLLGNRRVFKMNPQSNVLAENIAFYNVSFDDPEAMNKPAGFRESIAKFHLHYLSLMLKERRINYSKTNPGQTGKPHYVDGLRQRLDDTADHLHSLRRFFGFCDGIRRDLETPA
jgi:hypothetical protein